MPFNDLRFSLAEGSSTNKYYFNQALLSAIRLRNENKLKELLERNKSNIKKASEEDGNVITFSECLDEAIINNDVAIAKLLFNFEKENNVRFTEKQDLLLEYTIKKNHLEATKLLLDNDFKTTESQGTPLEIAIKAKSHEITIMFLEHKHLDKASFKSCFDAAIISGNASTVQSLIQYAKENNIALFTNKDYLRTPFSSLILNSKENNVVLLTGRDYVEFAIRTNNLEMTKILLDSGFRIGQTHGSPLIAATKLKKAEIVKLLLERKEIDPNTIKIGQTPLTIAMTLAAENGDLEIVNLLLEDNRVKKDLRDQSGEILRIAIHYNRIELIKKLLKFDDVNINYKGNISCTIADNRSDLTKLLLESGHKIRQSKDSPLLTAIKHKQIEIIELLLARDDVDPNVGDDQETPLILAMTQAIKNEDLVIVNLLLKNDRVEKNLKDKSGLLLYRATSHGNSELVKKIFECENVDINYAADTTGFTPLHNCALWGYGTITQLLLSHENINVNIQDKDGQTALHVAEGLNEKLVENLLVDFPQTNIHLENKNNYTVLEQLFSKFKTSSESPYNLFDDPNFFYHNNLSLFNSKVS